MRRALAQLQLVGFLLLSAVSAFAQGGVTLRRPTPPTVKRNFVAASVHALPGLHCQLYPAGATPSSGVTVFTDDDGFARFHAVRAAAGDAVRQLILSCTDAEGKASTYPVDLTSEQTFSARSVNLAAERGIDRPALQGDPLRYTQAQLLQGNYGLRPDSQKDPAAYSRWLMAAGQHGRILEAKRPDLHTHNVTTLQSPWWVGSVLTGSPNYISTEAIFNVPTGRLGHPPFFFLFTI